MAVTLATRSEAVAHNCQSQSQLAPKHKNIYVLHHGEAEHDITRNSDPTTHTWKNMIDPVLTGRGIDQAAELGRILAATGCAEYLIVSSPLRRALQTAEIIRTLLPIATKIVAHPALQETYYASDQTAVGDCKFPCDRGQPRSVLVDSFPDVDFSLLSELWMDDCHSMDGQPTDCEAWAWLGEQAEKAPGQLVLVVTHDIVLKQMLGWADSPPACVACRVGGPALLNSHKAGGLAFPPRVQGEDLSTSSTSSPTLSSSEVSSSPLSISSLGAPESSTASEQPGGPDRRASQQPSRTADCETEGCTDEAQEAEASLPQSSADSPAKCKSETMCNDGYRTSPSKRSSPHESRSESSPEATRCRFEAEMKAVKTFQFCDRKMTTKTAWYVGYGHLFCSELCRKDYNVSLAGARTAAVAQRRRESEDLSTISSQCPSIADPSEVPSNPSIADSSEVASIPINSETVHPALCCD